MILHPHHKLNYFKGAGWPNKWVKTAHQIVREEYECSITYKSTKNSQESLGEEDSDMEQDNLNRRAQTKKMNIFDTLPVLTAPSTSDLLDKLDCYLSTDPEHVPNALLWWHERCKSYPTLSRMVINYLSIPATAVDIEQVFSKGHILLPHVCNQLSAQSTHALMCIGVWSKLGYVKDADILSVTIEAEEQGEEQPQEDR